MGICVYGWDLGYELVGNVLGGTDFLRFRIGLIFGLSLWYVWNQFAWSGHLLVGLKELRCELRNN